MNGTEAGTALAGIVVGVDGSPLSVEALRWAARLEPVVGGPITAATVWQFPVAGAGTSYSRLDWDAEGDARGILEQAVEDAYGGTRPAGLTTLVASGPAAHTLIENSRNARLLIVGSRGIGGFMGLLLGSVSGACAEHAHCPVLVLHPSGDSGAASAADAGKATTPAGSTDA
ncbi:universal stress protein [Sinomonas sp. P10A9]|uniref:Universal stress protein n=1 Tax=Sinomonas puerhi TaxID=3238584 RepID=A0AB39KZZ8_9MICC